jgi:hypothetical protein
MTTPPLPGWPQPPYGPLDGSVDELMETRGWIALENPPPSPGLARFLAEWLVVVQARGQRVAIRAVELPHGNEGLLVVNRRLWECP